MASYKEPQVIRPQSSHRVSLSSTPTSHVSSRNTNTRHHSHSVSLGATNSSHRVTRRKSINSSAGNSATAIAAAFQEDAPGVSKRRSLNSKNSMGSRGVESGKHASSSHDLHPMTEAFSTGGSGVGDNELAVADDFLPVEQVGSMTKTKARRASEGSHLTKGEAVSSSPSHTSYALTLFHLITLVSSYIVLLWNAWLIGDHCRWEHTPEWSYTSKLLISKHQQVQLLEAASVLVGMNQDESGEIENPKVTDSDQSSASPAPSGSEGIRDDEDYSSAETTPPPMSDNYSVADGMDASRRKRCSGNSSTFSRSYQSAPSTSLPHSNIFSHYNQQRRPSTSGAVSAAANDEEAGLVAAVETLCHFGTPRNGPVLLPADVPPVPPLPARYVEENNVNRLSGYMGPLPEVNLPNPSYQPLSNERDVKMSDEHQREDDYDDISISHERSDEDDEFFGAMEDVSHEFQANQ
ncbi:hypothetical protein ACLMJK_008877 [Lecanora helva]